MSEEPMPTRRLHRRIFIGAPAETVWNWLVEPELSQQYHLGVLLAAPTSPGDAVQYANRIGWQIVIDGVAEEVQEGRKLVHTFQFQFEPLEEPSRVTYELLRYGDQMCCLDLTHEGLDPEGETIRNASNNWDTILSSLKTLVETGKPLPWPHRRR